MVRSGPASGGFRPRTELPNEDGPDELLLKGIRRAKEGSVRLGSDPSTRSPTTTPSSARARSETRSTRSRAISGAHPASRAGDDPGRDCALTRQSEGSIHGSHHRGRQTLQRELSELGAPRHSPPAERR
jgi:hypothetical protein